MYRIYIQRLRIPVTEMCLFIVVGDSVTEKYGQWLYDRVISDQDFLGFVLVLEILVTKITTEVSSWTEEEQATPDACEYILKTLFIKDKETFFTSKRP